MNLIPFETAKVPAQLSKFFGNTDDLVGNASSGFPVISIKGKVFHIQRGDERVLVTKPGDTDPAASIEVVILKANPNRSKVFYGSGYVEGSAEKPDCYSNDGIAPAKDAQEPQAKKCATCAHNQWGSKITESGAKSKACTDSRRIAVATVDTPADPMLLRVPAASMKALEDYAKQLAARNVPYPSVVTKVGFDYSVAYPALQFRPVGLIGDVEQLKAIKAQIDTPLVAQILGMQEVVEQDAPAIAPPSPPAKETAAPVKEAAQPAATATAPMKATPPARAKKAAEVAPAPAAEAVVVPAEATTKSTSSLEDEVESMLNQLDFDV